MVDQLERGDALLLVDVQTDFCPGGALAVPDGDPMVPVLNRWITAAREAGIPIYASRDWHPAGHVSFEERGGPWPPHCIQETEGAEIIRKGARPDRDQYSAFDGTGLGDRMRAAGVGRVWIGGLAQDVCVRASVLDALEEGFETHLIRPGTRPVDVQPGDGDRALTEMRETGAVIEEETEPVR